MRIAYGLVLALAVSLTAVAYGGPAAHGAAVKAGPLDGVYVFTITKAQDAKFEGRPVAENYGRFVTISARAHFASTQESDLACTWAYGTIRVKGHILEQRFTGGGGIAPNHANIKPGEFFVYRWALKGRTLELKPTSANGPPPLRERRISSTPSSRYLSHRCPPPRKALAALGLTASP
jgi:hypothetical protein